MRLKEIRKRTPSVAHSTLREHGTSDQAVAH